MFKYVLNSEVKIRSNEYHDIVEAITRKVIHEMLDLYSFYVPMTSIPSSAYRIVENLASVTFKNGFAKYRELRRFLYRNMEHQIKQVMIHRNGGVMPELAKV